MLSRSHKRTHLEKTVVFIVWQSIQVISVFGFGDDARESILNAVRSRLVHPVARLQHLHLNLLIICVPDLYLYFTGKFFYMFIIRIVDFSYG